MGYKTILWEKKDAIATLTLNRPDRLNALNGEMGLEMLQALRHAGTEEGIHVLIITGAGKAFCAGGEMQEILRANQDPALAHKGIKVFLDVFQAIRNLPFPVITKINGDAIGGGCGLALAGDFKMASEEARLGTPFIRIGLAGADFGVSYILPRLIGLTKVTEMLMLGQLVGAKEAQAMGLVNKAIPSAELQGEVERLADQLVKGPSLALKFTKMAISQSLDKDLATELDFEAYAQTACMLSQDVKEGVQAFLDKRKPTFQGR